MTSTAPSSPIQWDIVRRLLTNLNANNLSPGLQTSPLRLSRTELADIAHLIQLQHNTIASLTLSANAPPSSLTPNSVITASRSTRPPDYYTNAKFEDLVTRPLKPTYDGSPAQLMPFLNSLDIRRHDEGWYPITFLQVNQTKLDLLWDFTHIMETDICTAAAARWDVSTMHIDKHTVDTPTYNARILARLLFGSITDDFLITILHRIPEKYRNDGPYILWTIYNHIHCNNIAFIETIKQCIRDTALAQFDNNVLKHIMTIRDNLCLITTSSQKDTHKDLLT